MIPINIGYAIHIWGLPKQRPTPWFRSTRSISTLSRFPSHIRLRCGIFPVENRAILPTALVLFARVSDWEVL